MLKSIKRLLLIAALLVPWVTQAQITTFPYSNGFESGLDGWTVTDADNDGYTLADTDNLTGTTGIQVTAEPKDYSAAGFTHVNVSGKSVELGTIVGDGGLVLKVYYNRTMNTVSYSFEGAVPQGAGVVPGAAAYRHGATVNIAENPTVPAGYTFSGWTTSDATVSANSFTMPRVDVAFTGTFTANSDISYKIERYLQNPDGTYGVVLMNENSDGIQMQIEAGDKFFALTLPGRSVTTCVIPK